MHEEINGLDIPQNEPLSTEVVYNPDKDFYRGISGEFRMKAEGLFKKAKEKGISIEDIDVKTLKEGRVEFPGLGIVELPTYMVKVKGKHITSGQVMVDGKQIDYYNRYQGYLADKIQGKNYLRDERGRVVRENNRPKLKGEPDLTLSDWERFEVGNSLVDDKEFGLEKTITGACDRVIRKLMGENDWLSPDEARLLDEEYNNVQSRIAKEQEARKSQPSILQKKATDRQISYLKARIKNFGLDPDNNQVINEVLKHIGFEHLGLNDLSTGDMSKVIEGVAGVIPKVKEALTKPNYNTFNQGDLSRHGEIKQ